MAHNQHFKTATNQTPRYAQARRTRRERWLVLELKVLADVGLWLPQCRQEHPARRHHRRQAGRRRLPPSPRHAHPGRSPYRDQCERFDGRDIPGIIEGPARAAGIGLRFLRHIERNSVLLFLVPADEPDVSKAYNVLLEERRPTARRAPHKDRLLAISERPADEELMAEPEQELPGDRPPLHQRRLPGQGYHAEGPALAAVADGAGAPSSGPNSDGRYEPGPLAGRCGHRPVFDLNGAHAEWLDGPRSGSARWPFWFPLYAFLFCSSGASAGAGWRRQCPCWRP
ncbi:MAG: hypothetical protein R2810_06405 [Flavobacteriales bacterium]